MRAISASVSCACLVQIKRQSSAVLEKLEDRAAVDHDGESRLEGSVSAMHLEYVQ